MTIPGLRPWISPSQATPTTAPFGIGQIHAVWRDYVHEKDRSYSTSSLLVTAPSAPIRYTVEVAVPVPCMPTF